jgi:hypothetical protein
MAQNEKHQNPSWFVCEDGKQGELVQSRFQWESLILAAFKFHET